MDSGAFTTIAKYGGYPCPASAYAADIRAICERQKHGNLLAVVAQDYMCEAWMLAKTGLTVADHQRLTIEKYDELLACKPSVYIMPVLQGYEPSDYVNHLRQYGSRIGHGAWVGVGSICKRNGDHRAIEAVLLAIHRERPDIRLHGFGLKTTALSSGLVQQLLYSADSMAWSFAARKDKRNPNDWREAKKWTDRIEKRPLQANLFI